MVASHRRPPVLYDRRVREPRYIDPHKRRGRLYYTVARLSATRFGAWFSVRIAWKLDPFLLKLTGGRLSTAGPLAVALLESRGARTSRPRRNATLYFHDGDRVTIVASKRGCPRTQAGITTCASTRTSCTEVFRFAPSSCMTRPSADDFGNWPTASFPSTRTIESAPRTGRVIPIFQLTAAATPTDIGSTAMPDRLYFTESDAANELIARTRWRC